MKVLSIGFNQYVTFNRKEHNFLSQHNLIYLLKMMSIYEFPVFKPAMISRMINKYSMQIFIEESRIYDVITFRLMLLLNAINI